MQPFRELDANVRPLRRTEYEKLVEQGCFEGEPLELLWGSLVRMSPQKSAHAAAVQLLTRLFVIAAARGEAAAVRIQSPFAASDDSEPEPDVAVVPFGDYRDAHPAQALLIIEVAETSVRADRAKAAIYATAGVPEYWIVNLTDHVVEVHSEPVPNEARYAAVTVHDASQTLRFDALDDCELEISSLFGHAGG